MKMLWHRYEALDLSVCEGTGHGKVQDAGLLVLRKGGLVPGMEALGLFLRKPGLAQV